MWSSRNESIADRSAPRCRRVASPISANATGAKCVSICFSLPPNLWSYLLNSRRVIADPAHEGQAGGDVPYQSQVVRPEFATETLSQRRIVGIVGRRQIQGFGEDKRL